MDATDFGDFDELKEVILKRYDITDKSYRRKFRIARLKQNEINRKLQVHVSQADLVNKWMRECSTIEDVKDELILEQTTGNASASSQDVCQREEACNKSGSCTLG